MTFAHPNKEQLIAFGQGKLPADELSQIEQHLEVCRECCETLLDLKDDTFVGLLRVAKSHESGRRMGTLVRSESLADNTESDKAGIGKSADPTDAATVLVQSGETIDAEELPAELRDHSRYRIVELIGRGGMGSVYRAEHRLMNRPVAIKVINAQLVRHPQAVERFRREVQAAAKLSHPNIVAAHDAEQAGNAHFLVMEFVEGTDLASVVKHRGPMSAAEACECIRQAARGLQHAHEKGMVHRDIKPHNLMLAASGQVRILDFGLAGFAEAAADCISPNPLASGSETNVATNAEPDASAFRLSSTAAHLTTMGSVMGTPDYMAPEQAADAHSADIRADIYSLGCTLHFLLTGKPPFEADNVLMKLKAHAEQSPPPVTALRNDVPTELSIVVARMMAKNSADRFQSPAEVAAALAPFAQPSASPPRRHLRTLIAAVLLGLAGLLGGVIYVEFDKGQFIVETVDDQVAVMVGDKGLKIRDAVAKREYQLKLGAQRVRSGEYEIDVTELPDGLEISTTKFRLKRGGVERVTVSFKPMSELLLSDDDKVVLKAAEAFLAVADEGNFDKLYDIASKLAKKKAPREQVVPLYQQIRDTAGKVEKRTLRRVRLIDEFLGLPPGRYAAVQYASDFEKHKGLWESVLLNVDDDGQWRINTYAATFQPLPLPESKIKSGLAASEKSQRPTSPIPPAAVPTGANLILDPSFENTGLTQLPRDWRAWLNDGQEFRCEVVAGGRTGQRCLLITGKGTRGVVFANDMKADRTKRYALKGWAKFEGDKSARAIIKFNYFRRSEFLGVHDLVGATADQPGWHLFEKTDALDAYPTADHFYAMCTVEGSGSGWFDDLELVAYDRDKLPSDFDARHGRHNRLHGPNSLNRWVGTWDTEYAFRETDNSPQETKLAMTTTSERTLGDYFLLSHAKAVPVSPKGRKPTSDDPPTNAAALGGEERLLLLTFDQNLGAFRQWVFSNNGKVFEWRGPWNQEKQTLELRMLPDASNLHSSEHFVDDDHIEAKLKFQYVMGQRDAGRWTASRKAFDGKVDVPTAKSHVAEPIELSQLNKFVGEWTIHATYKPSVWNPQQREETITETSQWILGGRFLMTRAFNEKDELTSIWIATYEPKEKSNRFWFFNADGSCGEWRLTWDEPSSGFHFRAVDLPTGWSGTGFNRWIDEDTFDNQATIKDETGRVMLDMTQDKQRKK